MACKRILALDCGARCGWAFQYSNGQITTGVTPFLGTLNPGDRWLRFYDWLADYWSPAPEVIVHETPFIHLKHLNSVAAGYGFQTVVMLHCSQAKIRYVGVVPTTLKLFATGRGNADKFAMLKFARSMGWNLSDDNEIDARWLLEYARQKIAKGRAA